MTSTFSSWRLTGRSGHRRPVRRKHHPKPVRVVHPRPVSGGAAQAREGALTQTLEWGGAPPRQPGCCLAHPISAYPRLAPVTRLGCPRVAPAGGPRPARVRHARGQGGARGRSQVLRRDARGQLGAGSRARLHALLLRARLAGLQAGGGRSLPRETQREAPVRLQGAGACPTPRPWPSWLMRPPSLPSNPHPSRSRSPPSRPSSAPTPAAQVNQPVLQVRAVQKQSIMNYSFGQQSVFLRIVIALPSLMTSARRVLEIGRAHV